MQCNHFNEFQMSEASPKLSLRGPSGVSALFYLPHVKLNDGVWHYISLELQSDPKLTENHLLLFQVDYGQEEVLYTSIILHLKLDSHLRITFSTHVFYMRLMGTSRKSGEIRLKKASAPLCTTGDFT